MVDCFSGKMFLKFFITGSKIKCKKKIVSNFDSFNYFFFLTLVGT